MQSKEFDEVESAVQAVELMVSRKPKGRGPETLTQLKRRQRALADLPASATHSAAELAGAAVVLDLAAAITKAIEGAEKAGVFREIKTGVLARNTAAAYRRLTGIFTNRGIQREITERYAKSDFDISVRTTKLVADIAAGTRGVRSSSFKTGMKKVAELTDPVVLAQMTDCRWVQPGTVDELVTAGKALFVSNLRKSVDAEIDAVNLALEKFIFAHPNSDPVTQFHSDGDRDSLQRTIIQLATQGRELHRPALYQSEDAADEATNEVEGLSLPTPLKAVRLMPHFEGH